MHDREPRPSPTPILAAINAYQASAAMKAAIELDLFTAIAAGRETAGELADCCHASERGIRILCDYLVLLGFLHKVGKCYTPTPDAAVFLDRHSRAYMGGVIDFFLSPELTGAFHGLTETIRRGSAALSAEESLGLEPSLLVRFSHAMLPLLNLPIQLLDGLTGNASHFEDETAAARQPAWMQWMRSVVPRLAMPAPLPVNRLSEPTEPIEDEGPVIPPGDTEEAERPAWSDVGRAMLSLLSLPAHGLANCVSADPHELLKMLAVAAGSGRLGFPFPRPFSRPDFLWVKYARAMMPLMALPARLVARMVSVDPGQRLKVLDIAAGHGLFGIAIALQCPGTEIVALDWPSVLEVAQENARAAGVGARYRALPGSAFEVEYGRGYDLVLLANFLHHFDPPTCVTLLKRAHGALVEGGRAVILEFVPNEDRVSPPEAAAFSLMMLGTTPRGDAYPFSELEAMLGRAGFSRSELHPLPQTIQRVVIAHKELTGGIVAPAPPAATAENGWLDRKMWG